MVGLPCISPEAVQDQDGLCQPPKQVLASSNPVLLQPSTPEAFFSSLLAQPSIAPSWTTKTSVVVVVDHCIGDGSYVMRALASVIATDEDTSYSHPASDRIVDASTSKGDLNGMPTLPGTQEVRSTDVMGDDSEKINLMRNDNTTIKDTTTESDMAPQLSKAYSTQDTPMASSISSSDQHKASPSDQGVVLPIFANRFGNAEMPSFIDVNNTSASAGPLSPPPPSSHPGLVCSSLSPRPPQLVPPSPSLSSSSSSSSSSSPTLRSTPTSSSPFAPPPQTPTGSPVSSSSPPSTPPRAHPTTQLSSLSPPPSEGQQSSPGSASSPIITPSSPFFDPTSPSIAQSAISATRNARPSHFAPYPSPSQALTNVLYRAPSTQLTYEKAALSARRLLNHNDKHESEGSNQSSHQRDLVRDDTIIMSTDDKGSVVRLSVYSDTTSSQEPKMPAASLPSTTPRPAVKSDQKPPIVLPEMPTGFIFQLNMLYLMLCVGPLACTLDVLRAGCQLLKLGYLRLLLSCTSKNRQILSPFSPPPTSADPPSHSPTSETPSLPLCGLQDPAETWYYIERDVINGGCCWWHGGCNDCHGVGDVYLTYDDPITSGASLQSEVPSPIDCSTHQCIRPNPFSPREVVLGCNAQSSLPSSFNSALRQGGDHTVPCSSCIPSRGKLPMRSRSIHAPQYPARNLSMRPCKYLSHVSPDPSSSSTSSSAVGSLSVSSLHSIPRSSVRRLSPTACYLDVEYRSLLRYPEVRITPLTNISCTIPCLIIPSCVLTMSSLPFFITSSLYPLLG